MPTFHLFILIIYFHSLLFFFIYFHLFSFVFLLSIFIYCHLFFFTFIYFRSLLFFFSGRPHFLIFFPVFGFVYPGLVDLLVRTSQAPKLTLVLSSQMSRLALTSLMNRTTVPEMMTVTMTARRLMATSEIQMDGVRIANRHEDDSRRTERKTIGEVEKERERAREGVRNENMSGSDVEYVDLVVDRLCALYTAAASRAKHIPFPLPLPLSPPLGFDKTVSCSTTSSSSGLTVWRTFCLSVLRTFLFIVLRFFLSILRRFFPLVLTSE